MLIVAESGKTLDFNRDIKFEHRLGQQKSWWSSTKQLVSGTNQMKHLRMGSFEQLLGRAPRVFRSSFGSYGVQSALAKDTYRVGFGIYLVALVYGFVLPQQSDIFFCLKEFGSFTKFNVGVFAAPDFRKAWSTIAVDSTTELGVVLYKNQFFKSLKKLNGTITVAYVFRERAFENILLKIYLGLIFRFLNKILN